MRPGAGILFVIDEAQGASMEDLVALGTTFQQVLHDQDLTDEPDERKRGIALVFAALPQLMDEVTNNKVLTFLRRSVRHSLGEVGMPEVRDAFEDVVAQAGKQLDPALATEAARFADGHPYMVQLVGYHMWRAAERRGSALIEEQDVEAGKRDAMLAFYEAVCAPVYYGLRSPQRLFVEQMAKDERGVSQISDIVARAGRTDSWAHKYRASLIRERVIEAAGYGLVRFAVPHLGEYIRDEIFWHDPSEKFEG